jgi:hypothetical protein
MNFEPSYADKVGQLLLSMPIESEFVISEKVRPENVELFKDIVKSYIDRSIGKHDGFYIQPSNDWSKIKKFSK